ncbi:sigma-54-dependent transcriptional regulator [Ohtaekwangia kribbensis]|uniref:Sigma-54-dependent transcriptional regulator n=1 Tax=Ohtaekwangia kribbensis TaxID=688913 RepID=A0ABW3K1P9_9BACT
MPKTRAKILIVDDDADILTAARVVLRQQYESVETESNPQRLTTLLQQNRYDVILLDMNYAVGRLSGHEGLFWLNQILAKNPHQQVIMITAYGDIQLAVDAMKQGAADFVVKPWENEKLEATVQSAYRRAVDKKENSSPKTSASSRSRETEIIGISPAFKQVIATVDKVTGTDANVLLLGENGTGKELIASLIHQRSQRKDEAFVKVDAGALPATLFESELFGYKKGAFTDAREDRIGRMEGANRGTLFLDEIGNIPVSLQVKLLAALQNREVTPLGSNRSIPVDVRLICATNLDLQQAVRSGQFREDLLYRLNTIVITLPPLRDRTEDIPMLVDHFIKIYTGQYHKEEKSISQDAIRYLQKYTWPGNIRELQHAVERAVILSDETTLQKRDFMLSSTTLVAGNTEAFNLDEIERKTIQAAIQKYNGNLSKVAKELGVGRTTLYRKMEKYGLDK